MNPFPCPLCPHAFVTNTELHVHLVMHNEHAKPCVTFSIPGLSLIIVKPHPDSEHYKCPGGSCVSQGTLGAICIHWLADHAHIERAVRKRRRTLEIEKALYVPSDAPTPGYLNIREIASADLKFVSKEMSNVVLGCAYHQIMLGCSGENHSILTDCPVAEKSGFLELKSLIECTPHTLCHRCLCPQMEEFHHQTCLEDSNPNQGLWKVWWQALAYLVFRTKLIRIPVFSALGITEDQFSSVTDYVSWLTKPAQAPGPSRDTRITNLTMLAYVYFQKRIVIPGGGFVLDDTEPLVAATESSSPSPAPVLGSPFVSS